MGADAQYLEAGEDDDMHEPVFLGDEHGEVVADLDEEDDAPMSDSDDDEPARPPAADMEDRDAALGDEIEPRQTIPSPWSPRTPRPSFRARGAPRTARCSRRAEATTRVLHRVSGQRQRTRTSSAPPAAVTSHALRGHTDTVAGLAFNHDGSLLASAGLDGKALVWRVADPVAAPLALEGPGGGLEWVRWHPKGDVVLAGSEDFTAWMWNARDGALMQVFAGHSASVSCGGFAPDGKSVATGSSDGSLRLWAPRTGECATLFMGHPFHDGPVTCLDFHPSTEGLIVTGSEDNTARLVSGVSGKVLGTLAAHAETLECVGLSGDFPFAASGAIDAKLVVWDLNTLQPRNTLTHDKAVSALRWIPGTACLYRCVRNERNAKRRRLVIPERAFEPFFARSPDASSRLFFSRFATQRKGLARLFVPMRRWTTVCKTRPFTSDAPTVHRDASFAREQPASADTFRFGNAETPSPAPSPAGRFYRLIAVSRLPAHARLRDRVRADDSRLPSLVRSDSVRSDSRSSCIDGAVRLWDTRSSTCQAVQHGHVRGVLDFAPSPDFKSVVTASDDHTARVFRMVP